MCGIFGYVAQDKDQVANTSLLKWMAEECVSRGNHSHGISQYVGDKIHTFRSPGSFSDNLDSLDWCEGAKAVIGHTRYSTSGSPEININNQPIHWEKSDFILKDKEGQRITVDEMSMVHNGTLSNYRDLISRFNAKDVLHTDCDSEIIGYITRTRLALGYSMEEAITVATEALGTTPAFKTYKGAGYRDTPPYALMYLYQNKLHSYRDGNPLFWYQGDSGLYFSSVSFTRGYTRSKPELKYSFHNILTATDSRKAEDLKEPKELSLVWVRSPRATTKLLPVRLYKPTANYPCLLAGGDISSIEDSITLTEKDHNATGTIV